MAAGELARVYTHFHKYAEAQASFAIATRIFNRNPSQMPLIYSMILSYLGDYYMALGDWANAQAQYGEALKIQGNILGDHRAVAASMMSLSNALKKLHLKEEARDLMARAKKILLAEETRFQENTVDVLALRRQ